MAEIWRERLQKALWWCLVVALPFTSLPLVGRLTGSSMVAPAAGLVLVVIVLAWLAPHLLRGGKLGLQSLPLLSFLSVSLVSAAWAFFLRFPSFREFSLLNSGVDALVTLAMGACFYLAVAAWAVNADRLAFILRWINWSGLAIILYSLMQAVWWLLTGGYPGWMAQAQSFLVTHELYFDRVSGFAFEPSWLAHQLNMLYLPWWLASAVRGATVHSARLGPVTFERLLLAGGVLVLALSVSRIGLLGFLLMVAFLLLLGVLWLIRWLEGRLLSHSVLQGARRWWAGVGLRAGLFLGLLLLSLGMFLGVGYALSRLDSRMGALFSLQAIRTGSFTYYANQLVFAERIIFWDAGWQVFNRYPVLGVGPGNAGYFFPQTLSAFSWSLTEVLTLMYRQDVLPNIKSLWVRLLAETGMAGFACFLAFLYVHWRSGVWLRRFRGLPGTLGLAGLLMMVGLLTEGFSIDTFGLPYYWLSLGLVAGASLSVQRG